MTAPLLTFPDAQRRALVCLRCDEVLAGGRLPGEGIVCLKCLEESRATVRGFRRATGWRMWWRSVKRALARWRMA